MNDRSNAVRDLAQTVLDIAAVDVPELEVTDEMVVEESNGQDWIDVEADDAWWDAWCAIYDLVEEHGGAEIAESQMQPGVEPHRRFDKVRAETEYTSLAVSVYAQGDVKILAEYDDGTGSYAVLYEGRPSLKPPDGIEFGRAVASVELAALASQTGSAAAALDYWQTNREDGFYLQSEWANVRGVGRQTVNDRVAEVRDN